MIFIKIFISKIKKLIFYVYYYKGLPHVKYPKIRKHTQQIFHYLRTHIYLRKHYFNYEQVMLGPKD